MLARGAAKWVVAAWIPASVAALFSIQAGLLLLIPPLLLMLFFRDPERSPEGRGVVSPADGRVTAVDGGERVRVSVFMRPHDVHVNRAPVRGTVSGVEHHRGGHRPAFSKDSSRNERVVTTLEAPDGEYRVVQIAGAVARRITTYVEEGSEVERGERIGLIAFGSRADVVLPPRYGVDDVLVGVGDTVRAGETVVARRPG